MDRIAERSASTRGPIRFLNAYRNGDTKPHRKIVEDATLIETMQAAARARRPRAAGRARAMTSAPPRDGRGRGPLTMAKLRGTGIAAVNYPTGMNLGGDPSQALVHATTSGSFVVVAGGHRPRPGAPDGHRADRRRDARGRRSRRSSSTRPTPTRARTTWARSRAGRPTGWATRSIAAAAEARRVAPRGRGRGARGGGRRPRDSTATAASSSGAARAGRCASPTSPRGPSSSTAARSPDAGGT